MLIDEKRPASLAANGFRHGFAQHPFRRRSSLSADCALHFSRTELKADTRQAVIFANLEKALAGLVDIECVNCDEPRTRTLRPSGLCLKTLPYPVISFGLRATEQLGDSMKTIVFAAAFDAAETVALEPFIWSCAASRKGIAFGDSAWRSALRLPMLQTAKVTIPPLKLFSSQPEPTSQSALLIEHGSTELDVDQLAGELQQRRVRVERFSHSGWNAKPAAVHIHLGQHTLDSEAIRLVDSWRSGIPVVQSVPHYRLAGHDHHLAVDPERNGLGGRTVGAILDCYDELQVDRELNNKLAGAGLGTAEPLARDWLSIAEDLLT